MIEANSIAKIHKMPQRSKMTAWYLNLLNLIVIIHKLFTNYKGYRKNYSTIINLNKND